MCHLQGWGTSIFRKGVEVVGLTKIEDRNKIAPSSILGVAMKDLKGAIRCRRCGAAMSDSTGTCPKCGQAWCYVELYQSGRKFKYYRDSKNPNEKLGFLQAFSLLQEINDAIKKNQREKSGFNPADWQPESVKARQLANVLERWLEQKREEVKGGELSYGTVHAYQSRVSNHLSKLGHLDVREIKFSDLENFKDSLPKTIKLKTKREILNTLHAAMRWMWRKGIISDVPPFPIIKGNDSEPRIALSIEDQVKALNAIPEQHRDVFEFEFETGIRQERRAPSRSRTLTFRTEP